MKATYSDITAFGLALFSLFFGAGNFIFPPLLGQMAGEHLFTALIGFIITAVGMPLLGVLVVSLIGSSDPHTLPNRVNKKFSLIMMVLINLTIGPFFAIPRTAAVAFDAGMKSFFTSPDWIIPGLAFFSIIFFAVSYYFSINQDKLSDNVGKILTPALLISLTLLVINAFLSPAGNLGTAVGNYQSIPLAEGFRAGYLTMDTLASMVFGVLMLNIIKSKGITSKAETLRFSLGASLIAASCLSAIYISLAYLGATSVEVTGLAQNGGEILSWAANYYFGTFGNIILAIAFILACLTTSIGLMCSGANFFNGLFPKVSYKNWVLIIAVFSCFVANVGLTNLISISIPVLVFLYPIVIVLIALALFNNFIKISRLVYQLSVGVTVIMGLIEAINVIGLNITAINKFLEQILPLYNQGFGWILPALLTAIFAYAISKLSCNNYNNSNSF